MTNITKGYRICIHSYEGDANYKNTQILNGLTENEVKFYIYVASKFKSENGTKNSGFGNSDEEHKDEIINLIKEAIEKYGVNPWNIEDDNDFRYVTDYIDNYILGYPENHNLYYRAFDGYTVYYIPEEIEDVTEKFYVV